jgi:hypothetical protein
VTPRLYVLNMENQPVEVESLVAWAQWAEHANRVVGYTEITSAVVVSTIFLGTDHRPAFGKGPPLLFETMIFGGPEDGRQWRWSTWDDAEMNHNAIVATLRAKQKVRS